MGLFTLHNDHWTFKSYNLVLKVVFIFQSFPVISVVHSQYFCFLYLYLLSSLYLFRSFDPHQTGKIDEKQFRRIMRSKEAIPEEDVEEMLTGRNQGGGFKESDWLGMVIQLRVHH